jgi:NADH:ubiquinone oxidoreductase subunit 6 (subunit J)
MLAEVMVLARSKFPAQLTLPIPPGDVSTQGPGGVIGPLAAPLFREYLLAFELTSMLLLAAIVGAVVIGRKRT